MPEEFCETVAFHAKLDIMLVCAKMVCRPCLEDLELVRKDGHLTHVAGSGAFVFCSASPINVLMESYRKNGGVLRFSNSREICP
jgi:hypothetical protein